MTERTQDIGRRRAFDASVVLTNSIKLVGLGVAFNELLIRSELRPGALAIAAFMMAGAQGIESFLQAFLGSQAGASRGVSSNGA